MSEGAVKENIRLAVRNETGYVIACLAARNIERLKTLLDIAEETGRQAVITTRQAYLLNCLKGGGDFTLDLEDILIYGEAKAVRSTWERVLIETSGDRVITPARISKNPANYLLCLGYYDLDQLVDLNPRGGTYLYSSSEAHDEEMAIDLKRLENWAGEFGLKLYGLGKNSTLHSGGHIHAQGLIEMVETINPGFVIPVHTENPRWFKRNWGKRVIIPVAGKAINLI